MPKYRSKNFTDADINNIINLYELGYSIQQIRDITKIAKDVIKKYLVIKFDNEIPITLDEKSYFRKIYKAGKSITEISHITGRNCSVIRRYIKDLITDKEKEEEHKENESILKKKANKNSEDIINIYLNSSYEISDIAKYYNTSNDSIRKVIKSWVDKYTTYDKIFEKPINIIKEKIFKDFYCNIGDKYEVIVHTFEDGNKLSVATIKELYPKIVMTDKGSFSYRDIILDSKLISRNIKNN